MCIRGKMIEMCTSEKMIEMCINGAVSVVDC